MQIFKITKKKFISASLFLCIAAGLAGCSGASNSQETPTQSDTLRVGVRDDVMGFGYYNEETGKYYGLEIDIANVLADRLGYASVSFETVLPQARKDMLLSDEVDCIIACFSIAESGEDFDFSPAYFHDASIVLLEDSSLFTNIMDMQGCTFGAMKGSNVREQLAEKLKEIGFSSGELVSASEDDTDFWYDTFHVVQLDSYPDLDQALEVGKIDAMCADGSIAMAYVYEDRNILSDFVINTQEYGVATKKNSVLSEPVSETIQGMLDDGTIAELVDKWD